MPSARPLCPQEPTSEPGCLLRPRFRLVHLREQTFLTAPPRSAGDPKPKLVTLCVKLIKIGAKIDRHGRYVTIQPAEVEIPRRLFADILRLIDGLRPALLPPSR